MTKREIVFYLICVLILIWVFASWVDVAIHNGNVNPTYQWWNMFTLLFLKKGN